MRRARTPSACRRRLGELGAGGNPLSAGFGIVESVLGQFLALSKTPFDLLRGSGGEEKILKNAKDTCATEALEIATYAAIEHVAERVGDAKTARLAASIRADEERMLARVMRALRPLSVAVVGAEVDGDPSYDVGETGAAESRQGDRPQRQRDDQAHGAQGAQGARRRAGRG